MADEIDGLKLGFENLRIGLVVPGIKLGVVNIEADMTWLSHSMDPHFSRASSLNGETRFCLVKN